jgi:hypothetical protein
MVMKVLNSCEKKKIIEDLDELKLYIVKDVQYAIRQQIL